jgi:hypothetical protein
MNGRRVRVQLLLGKKVRDPSGKCAGRIEEIVAEEDGDECLVSHYLLGRSGLIQRLSVTDLSVFFLRFLGALGRPRDHRVSWEQMDLSDPRRPRLRCSIEELKAMQPPQRGN